MDLTITDVSDLLGVSEVSIRRWMEEEKIPYYHLQNEVRFSRLEVERWMMQVIPGEGKDMIHPRLWRKLGLYRAVHKGTVINEIKEESKEALIREVMNRVAPLLDLDAEGIAELLLDRERLMSTSLGGGLAVPHTRDFLLGSFTDVVLIVFPQKPIDWGALDQKPVHTLFFLFACDDKRHLNLLAKIAHLASQPEALKFFETKPDKKHLLTFLKEWETAMAEKSPAVC